MDKEDVVKYSPTSTVGKIVDIKEEDGKTWIKLDTSGLYYVASTIQPADPSEYKTTSFKERKSKEYGNKKNIDDLEKMEREVDISEMMPSGGG